jgi:hypothetical protein
LDLSLGSFSVLGFVRTEEYILYRDAFIPLGGSKTILKDYLIKVVGTLGLNSLVKNSLKFGCGVNL